MNRFSERDAVSRRVARSAPVFVLFIAVIGVPEPALAENAVTRWTEHAMQAVRAANVGTPAAGRLYAMVTAAMYDSVNGIDTAGDRFGRQHALVTPDGAPRRGSRDAAVAAAAHAVLVALVPSQQATLDPHFTWRPFTAIREAEADGNPDTAPDPAWTPRNTSIGASPEWTSGLSTFSGAASAVIEAFYFPRRVSFCFATDLATEPRCYDRPLDAAVEAGRSRIYQGIHFQFSNLEGRRVGRRIGLEVASTQLQFCFPRTQICVP